ncbi:hypothetical protein E4U57_007792 [Claviceps arundinis]|uniref:Tc1-like transposase DDE domain-containing protein n=1 Tax=Claviceps arundinis TaxID=1623583 RepID=A0A9P7SRQ3_9HYPO|nr:hypothetical protein E4U57_007792 [Claviceps arundinis]KAG5970241.1 hypothetical protein E4U56_007939 [Claviceps arundinis]
MDKVPAHAYPMQQRIYDQYEVSQLLWCGNSPDLNMIEPAWAHLKRETTTKASGSCCRLESRMGGAVAGENQGLD